MSVRDRYLVGKLAPRIRDDEEGIEGLQGRAAVGQQTSEGQVPSDLRPHEDQRHEPGEEFSSTDGTSDPDESDTQEIDASKNQSFVPSSIGVTVCIDGAVDTLDLEVRWGRYERLYDHCYVTERKQKNKKTGEIEIVEVKERVWKRVPSGGRIVLPMRDGPIKPVAA